MAAGFTTITIVDGSTTSRSMRVWDEGGPGPYSFAQANADLPATTMAKVTVTTTSSYLTALSSSINRRGATIQYIAVAGSLGYVYFGSSSPADTTTSFQLSPGQVMSATVGSGVITDGILVTATTSDIFIVMSQ